MKIIVNEEDKQYLKECLESGEVLKEDLRRWFKEKWVDVSRKIDGKHPPCGRKDADGDKERKGYPKCRPLKKVSKDTPKTAGSYSKNEKKSMTTQKRNAEKKEPKIGKGNKPTFTRFDENNIITLDFNEIMETYSPPKLSVLNESKMILSEGLNYHITQEKPLIENVYRIYSEKFFNLFNESRNLYDNGILLLEGDDLELIKTDIGLTGIYEGEEVYLDIPFVLNIKDSFSGSLPSFIAFTN
jgi:hypothetical protein